MAFKTIKAEIIHCKKDVGCLSVFDKFLGKMVKSSSDNQLLEQKTVVNCIV
jgi:hypothetical protein